MACNPRNSFPGTVFNNANHKINLYGDNIEVDYRGYEVTVENFIRVLTGRHSPEVPRSKRLLTDDRSNILVYLTGHGGDEFLKFQDAEEISSHDIADAFEQMYQKKRYHEIFFMADTCQAATLQKQFYSPNIIAIGSSKYGENSYSHHVDYDIGVAVIDRFTYFLLEFFEEVDQQSKQTLNHLFKSFNPSRINSHPEWRDDLFKRTPDQTLITDFFGSVLNVELTSLPYILEYSNDTKPTIQLEDTQQFQTTKRHIKDISFNETKPPKSTQSSHVDTFYNFNFLLSSTIFVSILVLIVVLDSPISNKTPKKEKEY